MSFDNALAAERRGDFVLAAHAYERSLSGRPGKWSYMNLAGIYWQAHDPGFVAAHRLDVDFMHLAGSHLHRTLETGIASFPNDPDIEFLNRYIRWTQGEPLSNDDCVCALSEMDAWPLPILRLPSMATPAQFAVLEKWSVAAGTVLAEYVLSVLQSYSWLDETSFPRSRSPRTRS